MDIKINNKSFFVFDLDDTLYYEIDFLKSGYKAIADFLYPIILENVYDTMIDLYQKGMYAFEYIVEKYKNKGITVEQLLSIYRFHEPQIKLRNDASVFLQMLHERNVPIGLITDGRSITQRNKLKSLLIDRIFNDIIISEEFGSEKPDIRNYDYFNKKYSGYNFFFFADNLKKDFIVPVNLKWTSFCLLDNGLNIHKQEDIHRYGKINFIDSFNDINIIYG